MCHICSDRVALRVCRTKWSGSLIETHRPASVQRSAPDPAPRRRITQHTRTRLAATATVTFFGCIRVSSAVIHRPPACCSHSRCSRTERPPWPNNQRRSVLPRLLMPSNLGTRPVPCCRSTRPNRAARSRPRPNSLALPTAATRAVAVSGPTPGTASRRRQRSSALAAASWASMCCACSRASRQRVRGNSACPRGLPKALQSRRKAQP